jgi:hypothetical protein
MTKWKYTLSGGFYANGPVSLSVGSGDVAAARQEIATREQCDVDEVADVWETSSAKERELAELLLSRAQMDMFKLG